MKFHIFKPTFISCLFIAHEETSKKTIIATYLIVGLFDAPFEASFAEL